MIWMVRACSKYFLFSEWSGAVESAVLGANLRYPPLPLPDHRHGVPAEAGGRLPPLHRPRLAPPRNLGRNNRPEIKQIRAADEFRDLGVMFPNIKDVGAHGDAPTSVQYNHHVLPVPPVNHHACGGHPVNPHPQGGGGGGGQSSTQR